MSTSRAVVLAFLLVLAGLGGAYTATSAPSADLAPDEPTTGPADSDTAGEFATFASKAEFREYVRQARTLDGGPNYFVGDRVNAARTTVEEATTTQAAESTPAPSTDAGAAAGDAARHSGTNVQVQGIDEPDIVKTDGRTIYYSGSRSKYGEGETHVIDARSPENASVTANVDRQGRLFLLNETLVVLADDHVYGYDVSDPENPTEEWDRALDSGVVTARYTDGRLYLVLASHLRPDDPCPVEPAEGVTVRCTDVHRPSEPVPVDTTYTALTLDPDTGEVGESVSYVGSRHGSAVYMSGNALYTTYVETEGRADLYLEFLLTDARPLLDDDVAAKLDRLQGYELSDRAKLLEARSIVSNWLAMQGEDERRQVETELENRFRTFADEHKREATTTKVVKIAVDGGLSVEAVGSVPGRPLNQFSLDEHDGHLRIATTVEGFSSRWGGTESVNDVYVLDENLDVVGSVTGMGEDERIYSVRFMGDTGYVVTFKRIDPFHVLDLSDPENPTLEGELKLPGFSSYLHPLGDDRVLGIGEEDGRVKAVVFDVSDPSNPTVQDDYVLDEGWSEIARTHHAFLLDPKHEVFFLPGGQGGYVFSYEDGLSLEKAVATERARRALYIDDTMYVFGESEVVVLDESTWERVRTIDLDGR